MEEQFSNNELEKRLKEEAAQFELTPSDKVWEGISDQLHPRRAKRAWIWAAAGLLALLSLGGYFIFQPQMQSVDDRRQATNTVIPGADEGVSGKAVQKNTSPASADNNITSSVVKQNQESRRQDKNNLKLPVTTLPANDTKTSLPADLESPVHDRDDIANMLPYLYADHRIIAGIPDMIHIPYDVQPAQEIPRLQNQMTATAEKSAQTPDLQQQEKITITPKRHAAFEVFFTSGKGYRTLGIQNKSAGYRQMQVDNVLSGFAVVRKKYSIEHKPAWNMSAGVRGIFPLDKHWNIETGVSVTRFGYQVKAFGTYPAYVRNDGTQAMASPLGVNSMYSLNVPMAAALPPAAFIQNKYLYGEIPVLISRQFGRPDKIHFTVGTGGGLLYLLHSSAITYSPESGRYFTQENLLKPVNVSLHLEANAIFPLSRKLNVTVGPSLEYQLLSTYKDYPKVKEHPYFPGITAGLQWVK